MNCPNCDKKPVGLLPEFRPKRVGFKKALNGYLRCRHCNTLLKKETEGGFPKFEKPYVYIQITFILLLVGGLYLMYFLMGEDIISPPYALGGFFVYLFSIFGVVDSFLKPKFWIIKEVDEEEAALGIVQKEKLTPRGWAMFTLHIIVAVLLMFGGMKLLQEVDISEYLGVALFILYGIVVGGGVMLIFRMYSEKTQEEAQ